MGKRVLFVDDEPNILKSIKRNFMLSDLEIITADGPVNALEILQREKVDVVVSDVKMPVMNGIEFLTIVKERFPGINRVILSGFVERDAVLRAVTSGVAFDYFAKPWEHDILIQKIKHILTIREILKNDDMRKLVNSVDNLPKIPEVARKVSKAIEDGASFDAIGEIVSSDVGIATKVLQLVNSAFYSGEKISSIGRAVAIIGLNSMKNIVFTSAFMEEAKYPPDVKIFITKEVELMAKVNKVFGKLYEFKYNTKIPEEYLSIGLLYNIGKLIIIKCMLNRFKETIKAMKSNDINDFYKAEIKIGFEGITHCEIGAYFLELWNFSGVNVEAALFHHSIDRAKPEVVPVLKILKIAEIIARDLNPEKLAKLIKSSKSELDNFQEAEFVGLRGELNGI